MSTGSGRRILMTTDGIGGVWTYARALSQALARHGDEVLLLVMGPPPAAADLDALGALPRVSVEATDFALEWMDPDGGDMARAHRGLRRIADRFAPDIVHINGFRDACAEWDCPVLLAAHSCVWSWWRACRNTDPDAARWWRYIGNVRRGLDAADRWVAPTRAFRDSIASLYAPRAAGAVIWNGHAARAPVAAKEPLVLTAGRLWDEAKNVGALAAVADGIGWDVRFAGAASATGHMPADPRYLGALSRTGMLELMERAAIYAAPARYEPFGLAILEAAAAGCALVLSDLPSLRELWDDAALFVAQDDPNALGDALRRLVADGALRQRLQQAARRRAARYSLARMAHGYRQIYASLQELPARPVSAPASRPDDALKAVP